MTKTYAQIAREIAALQATASKLYAVEIKSAVAKVNELIAQYGLSADDLKFGTATAAGKPTASATVAKAAAAGAKYSDGQGRIWGGRGPRPAWLRNAIAAGRSLESFLTAGAADIVAAFTPSKGGAGKKSASGKPASTGIAKYVNPKTGAGWSGRGPRPQWLKDALKKRGSKIEDFLGDKPVSNDAVAVMPAEGKSAAPAKKVVAKKAVAKNAVAQKTVARKVMAKTVAAKKEGAIATPAAPAKKAAVKVAAKKAVAKVPAKKAVAKKVAAKKAAVSGAAVAMPTPAPAGAAPAPVADV